MSAYRIKFNFHEEVYDKNGDFLAEYGYNLPHFNKIKEGLESSFNDIFGNGEGNPLSNYFDEPLKGIVQKGKLQVFQSPDGEAYGIVTITLKPHNFLSEKRADLFDDWFDAQMSDGWGEGVFIPNFIEDGDLSIGVECGSNREYGRPYEELREQSIEEMDLS